MNSQYVTLILFILTLTIVSLGMHVNLLNNVNAQLVKMPTVKITSPTAGEQVNILDNNTIFSGISSDNSTSNCQVSVILNNIKPYQPTRPAGPNDYSSWNLDQGTYYINMKEGQNKLTSKISCLANPANLTKWSSVNFTGVVNSNASIDNQSGQLEENETSQVLNGNNINQTGSIITSAKEEIRQLAVKVQADKNPVYLGDAQIFTLIVSDAASHIPVPNAEIKGVVTLPSGKSKEFSVTTDTNGHGSYTLKIGKTAELGKTNILFQVTSFGYEPLDVKSTSEIKDNSPANPFGEQISLFSLPFQPKDIFSWGGAQFITK
jgi:hypothetical protein